MTSMERSPSGLPNQSGQYLYTLSEHEVGSAADVVTDLTRQKTQFFLDLLAASAHILPFQAALDAHDPLVERFGFVDKIFGPSTHCRDHIFIEAVRAQHNDVGLLQYTPLLHLPERLHPVQVGHVDVKEYHIVSTLCQAGQRLLTTRRSLDLPGGRTGSATLKKSGHFLAEKGFVIYDKNGSWSCRHVCLPSHLVGSLVFA